MIATAMVAARTIRTPSPVKGVKQLFRENECHGVGGRLEDRRGANRFTAIATTWRRLPPLRTDSCDESDGTVAPVGDPFAVPGLLFCSRKA